MGAFEDEVERLREWMSSERFAGTTRVHTARQIAEQRGTVPQDYTVARDAAEQFYDRLREMFAEGKSITSFGPYSPGQAVQMKRAGIEGIYLGGWATSAKGSTTEDPGPDLASYPLSQVPDEAAGLVRALLTADKNQVFARARMSEAEREATPEVDFRPFIVADADTGHGGDAHVRNLVRRFVEVGVPGYHIEDQKPGAKKCGHQGGKVLVPEDEQIKRLSAARFQLDIMGVPGIIVARTDAEAANLLDGAGDERDQPFILGVTNTSVPSYKSAYLAVIRRLNAAGVEDLKGHLIYAVSDLEYADADAWLEKAGVAAAIDEAAKNHAAGEGGTAEDTLDLVADTFLGRVAGRRRPAHARRRGGRADRLPRRRGVGPRHHRRGVARIRLAGVLVRHPGQGEGAGGQRGLGRRAGPDPRGLLPDPGRHPLRDREVAGGRAVRRPALDGDQDGGPGGREGVRGRDPRRLPRQDAGLQPVAVLQLGHDRHERRRDAPVPGGAGEDGLRLQLHDLRRPPDRRPGGGGVHDRPPRGRHARAGAAAAEVPAAGVAVPHAPDPGGRAARRRRPDVPVGPDGHHQGHGRGLHPEPAPGADRGAAEGPGRLARPVGRAQRHRRAARRVAAAPPRPARSCSS